MYFDYLTVLIFASVGLVFVFANLIIASVLRPKRTVKEGLEIYECGEETIGEAWVRFDIRYYTVALVYVIFAVEIAFLFPWAIVLRESLDNSGAAAGLGIGVFALVEGFVFIAILFLGLAYVWAKGDLDWVLTYSAPAYQPPTMRMRAIPTVDALEGDSESSDDAAEADESSDESEDAA